MNSTFLKLPFFLLAVGILGFLLIAGIVTAQTSTDTGISEDVPVEETTPAPAVLEIGSDGTVLVRGIVTGVNGTSMTIESWLGEWTIEMTGSGAVITGGEVYMGEMPQIQTGNFVGVEGTLDDIDAMTVNAIFIRNWSTDPIPAFGDIAFSNPLAETSEPMVRGGAEAESSMDTTPTSVGASPVDIATSSGEGSGTTSSGVGSLGIGSDDTATSGTSTDTDDATSTSMGTDTDADEAPVTGWSGTIDEISNDSLTFTDDHNNTYTVDLTSAVLTDDSDELIRTDEIEVGDEVSIDGTIEGEFITASQVWVDMSLLPF